MCMEYYVSVRLVIRVSNRTLRRRIATSPIHAADYFAIFFEAEDTVTNPCPPTPRIGYVLDLPRKAGPCSTSRKFLSPFLYL